MTDNQLMSEDRNCGEDAAAYVLGALEGPEAEAFRLHLASCTVCRDEVSTFQDVADVLALAVPRQEVPTALKRRVMAGVRAEPGGAKKRSPGFSRRPTPAVLLALSRPALAAGAVVAVVAATIGALVLAPGTASTRVIQAKVDWPGSAVLRVSGGRGELIVRRMPAPPSGKVYEVWLQRRGKGPSATSALFDVTSTGSGSVDVPDLHGVGAVMVTPEPLGGSEMPTHAAVLVARLT